MKSDMFRVPPDILRVYTDGFEDINLKWSGSTKLSFDTCPVSF